MTDQTRPAPRAARRSRRPAPLTVLTVVSMAALVIGYRADLASAATIIGHARPGWLALLTVLALAGVLLVGLMFSAGQRAAGSEVPFRDGLRLGIAAYALNLIVKSSGLAGLALFLRYGRRRGRSDGPVIAGYLLSTFLNHLAFGAALLAALVAVGLGGRLTATDVVAAALFAVYVVGHAVAAWAALRHPAALRRLYAAGAGALSRLRRLMRRPDVTPTTSNDDAADELGTALNLIHSNPPGVAVNAVWALGVDLIHIVWLWAALHAVDAQVGVDVALVAYGVARSSRSSDSCRPGGASSRSACPRRSSPTRYRSPRPPRPRAVSSRGAVASAGVGWLAGRGRLGASAQAQQSAP